MPHDGDYRASEDEIRSSEQNKRFHAMLTEISDQIEWAGAKRDPEFWKRVMLAAKYGQEIVPNPLSEAGEPIVVNVRVSRGLTVHEMSEFLMEIQVFGDERGVTWGAE